MSGSTIYAEGSAGPGYPAEGTLFSDVEIIVSLACYPMNVEVTIQGLRVPELERRLEAMQDQLTNVRVLLSETAAAVVRVDEDVQLILKFLEGKKE